MQTCNKLSSNTKANFVIFTNQHSEFINHPKNELDNKVKIIQYFENSEN